MLCKGRGFCGAMGNDASRVTVDVCRRSLVRARVWAKGRSKIILLHVHLTVAMIVENKSRLELLLLKYKYF